MEIVCGNYCQRSPGPIPSLERSPHFGMQRLVAWYHESLRQGACLAYLEGRYLHPLEQWRPCWIYLVLDVFIRVDTARIAHHLRPLEFGVEPRADERWSLRATGVAGASCCDGIGRTANRVQTKPVLSGVHTREGCMAWTESASNSPGERLAHW